MGKSKVEEKLKMGSKAKMESKHNTGSKKMEGSKEQIKKKKHKSNPLARRRLRAAIMAVYFSIFLPSFSRKIYQNKLKMFMSLYPHEINKYLDKKGQVSRFKQE